MIVVTVVTEVTVVTVVTVATGVTELTKNIVMLTIKNRRGGQLLSFLGFYISRAALEV